MQFVIDTVGDIDLPDGSKAKGVILAVPASATPEQEAAAMREAARLWADRVTLQAAPQDWPVRQEPPRTADAMHEVAE